MLRPQDIVVLLKLASGAENGPWLQRDIARDLHISPAEVHKALRRAAESGLYRPGQRKVTRHALFELVIHGLKYVYPAQLGAPARGIPTAWGAAVLRDRLVSNEADRPVWPHAEGTARGPALCPLYKSVPAAALEDPALYDLLALVDAIRLGGARERTLAIADLKARLLS